MVESPVPGALGEFDIDGIDPATDITGTNGKFPEVGDAAGSSFFLTITEPEASITLPVFDDIVGEDVQELPFNIVNGELYEVDPDADGIALNIADEQGGTGVGRLSVSPPVTPT